MELRGVRVGGAPRQVDLRLADGCGLDVGWWQQLSDRDRGADYGRVGREPDSHSLARIRYW